MWIEAGAAGAGGQQSAHGRSQWAISSFVCGQPRWAPREYGPALITQYVGLGERPRSYSPMMSSWHVKSSA